MERRQIRRHAVLRGGRRRSSRDGHRMNNLFHGYLAGYSARGTTIAFSMRRGSHLLAWRRRHEQVAPVAAGRSDDRFWRDDPCGPSSVRGVVPRFLRRRLDDVRRRCHRPQRGDRRRRGQFRHRGHGWRADRLLARGAPVAGRGGGRVLLRPRRGWDVGRDAPGGHPALAAGDVPAARCSRTRSSRRAASSPISRWARASS